MIFAFGDSKLDTDTLELRRAGAVVSVEPQVFDVLAYLVTHRDRLVRKAELLDEVWGDRFVSDSALTSRIKDARRAVGDDGRRQAVIRTIHGRGYRFVAPVEAADAGGAPDRAGGGGVPEPPAPPRTHYARSGRYSIAYQVVGAGPGDLVFIPGFVSNIELQWEFGPMASFFRRLARGARLIVFDKRGTGLSDRVPVTDIPPLEERMDDVRAVMDAAGSERATLFGISEGGPLALLFAATYPERVERLILFNSYADRFRDDIPAVAAATREHWGTGGVIGNLAPSWRDRGDVRFLARYERHSATPDAAAHLIGLCDLIDVRPILPSISAPTMVVHRRDDAMFPLAKGEALAARIPGAELVVLEGPDHLVYVDQEPVLDAVEEFITGTAPTSSADRVLTTMLFAEVAGSAASAERPGDARPGQVVRRFHELARDALAQFRGDEVATTGDGLLATFDGPARAVRCAQSLRQAVARLELPLRIGVHTAEVERLGDDIAGLGVHIGARVAAAAPPGEIWVTRIVRDLVAGSGLQFEARGTHEFTGIGEPWELHAAVG
ncbi:MAG TPA: alpha/beta fold hydrolase [Acidimicrobiales bacterium]|nr:alpha/beta fold hydrolase [Acidimicrobiales bacterium]